MKLYDPKIIVLNDPEYVAGYVAGNLIVDIRTNPKIKLTMPTGKTPELIYAKLVEAYVNHKVSFEDVSIFNLDEYWPIEPNSPDSYRSYMKKRLIEHIDIKPENWHIPNGGAVDPNKEAERYEDLVVNASIDVSYLGLGPGLTCHVGFNEPGSLFESKTRLVKLLPETVAVNQKNFVNPNDFVDTAITQGLGTIMKAGKIVMIVTGKHKAEGVRRFLKGDVSEDAPATVLRLHKNVEVVMDDAAASLL